MDRMYKQEDSDEYEEYEDNDDDEYEDDNDDEEYDDNGDIEQGKSNQIEEQSEALSSQVTEDTEKALRKARRQARKARKEERKREREAKRQARIDAGEDPALISSDEESSEVESSSEEEEEEDEGPDEDELREQAASKLQAIYRARIAKRLLKSLIRASYCKIKDELNGGYLYKNKRTGQLYKTKPKFLGKDDLPSPRSYRSPPGYVPGEPARDVFSLVISNTEFMQRRIPQMQRCHVYDYEELEEIFIHPFLCRVPVDNFMSYQNTSKDMFEIAMRNMIEMVRMDAAFVMYLHTHIIHIQRGNRKDGYIVMKDSILKSEKFIEETCVSLTEFGEMLKAMRTKERVIFLDCCHICPQEYSKIRWKSIIMYPPPNLAQNLARKSDSVIISGAITGYNRKEEEKFLQYQKMLKAEYMALENLTSNMEKRKVSGRIRAKYGVTDNTFKEKMDDIYELLLKKPSTDFSCRELQLIHADEQHSLFAGAVLGGLMGDSIESYLIHESEGGMITARMMIDFLKKRMKWDFKKVAWDPNEVFETKVHADKKNGAPIQEIDVAVPLPHMLNYPICSVPSVPPFPSRPWKIQADMTSISIQWQQPFFNGSEVLRYGVEIRGKTRISDEWKPCCPNAIIKTCELRVPSLPSGFEFRFRVRALNKGGWSEFGPDSNFFDVRKITYPSIKEVFQQSQRGGPKAILNLMERKYFSLEAQVQGCKRLLSIILAEGGFRRSSTAKESILVICKALKLFTQDKELQCIGSILLGWACFGRPILANVAMENDGLEIIAEAQRNFANETAVLSSMGWFRDKMTNPGIRQKLDDPNDPLSPVNKNSPKRKTKGLLAEPRPMPFAHTPHPPSMPPPMY